MPKQISLFSNVEETKVCCEKADIKKEQFVPLEDSIFARPKRKAKSERTTESIVTGKEKKENIRLVFEECKKKYILSCNVFRDRFSVLEPVVFDRCCELMMESLEMNIFNPEAHEYLKSMIKSVCKTQNELVYYYSNIQGAMIQFLNDCYPDMDTDAVYMLIDNSYAQVFKEMRGGCNGNRF